MKYSILVAGIILLSFQGLAGGEIPAEPCGTPALLQSQRLDSGADPLIASRPSLSGPVYTIDSPGGHFKVHWTDTGSDSVVYDYACSIALAADTSWAVQCDDLGFYQPPPDNGVGGDDLYDIYIVHLSGGSLGYSSWSGEYHPPDSTHDCSASYIITHSDIADTDQRDCVIAHEFQHAVQASYDYNESTWFMENCAVWMTEMVFPEADDYLGCINSGENALRTPWLGVGSYSSGGFPLPWMMWNRWGYQSVRSVWEYCALQGGNNTFEATESMLADNGLTFEEFFMDYGVWRWFTAENWYNGCNMYNQEASEWLPGPRVLASHEVTGLPFSGDQTADYPPEQYGIHWIRVDLSNYQDDWIMMNFDGLDSFEWNMGVIRHDLSGQFNFEWLDCDSVTGDLELLLEADGWDYFIFFPAFMDVTSLDHLYEISISQSFGIEGSSESDDGLDLRISSNPLFSSGSVAFNIPSAGQALLQVYDMSGRAVATLLDGEIQSGSHTVQFNTDALSSGTYFLMLFSEGYIAGSRIVLVRY